jgi:hypothetical protein
MKKIALSFALCLALPLIASTVSAKTIKVPEDAPAISVNVPDSWKPEDTDKGITTESPDQEATVMFEVTDAKSTDKLVDENVAWLKEQKVTVDQSTKSEKDFKTENMTFSRISWDGKDEEYGPATIGFAFADVGNGKVLVVTYWITKKGMEKHEAELNKILNSVKKSH